MTLTPDLQTTLTGGALAVLLLREVFSFVKVLITKDRRHNGAGEKSVEFWEQTQRRIIREEIAEHTNALREATQQLQNINWSVGLIVEWIKQEREDQRRR